MAKGLSNHQKAILRILSTLNGCRYYSEFIPKVKTTLYPNLWIKVKWDLRTGIECKNWGDDLAEKNSARVTLSKSITRLINRKLIEQKQTEGWEIRIFLTSSGWLLVNER